MRAAVTAPNAPNAPAVGRGGEERVGTEAAAGLNGGAVVKIESARSFEEEAARERERDSGGSLSGTN